MELVTHPDLKDGEDAASFVRELQMLLQTVGTCDGKMQGGYSLSVGGYRFVVVVVVGGGGGLCLCECVWVCFTFHYCSVPYKKAPLCFVKPAVIEEIRGVC